MSEELEGREVVGTQTQQRINRAQQIADASEQYRAEREDFDLSQLDADKLDDNDGFTDDSEHSLDNQQEQAENKHKIKVNGKEIELTYEELVARAQKVEAADQYLAEASKLAKSSKHQEEVVEAQDQFEDELAIVRAIQMGDEQEALQAIRKLRNTPPAKTDDIASLVDNRIAAQKAWEAYSNDYSDIVNDPMLHQLAVAKDAQLMQEGDTRPYAERWAAIGDELREWVSAKIGNQKMAQKEAKKSNIVNINRAGSKTAAPADEDAEESASDIIRAMAKRRGQI